MFTFSSKAVDVRSVARRDRLRIESIFMVYILSLSGVLRDFLAVVFRPRWRGAEEGGYLLPVPRRPVD